MIIIRLVSHDLCMSNRVVPIKNVGKDTSPCCRTARYLLAKRSAICFPDVLGVQGMSLDCHRDEVLESLPEMGRENAVMKGVDGNRDIAAQDPRIGRYQLRFQFKS